MADIPGGSSIRGKDLNAGFYQRISQDQVSQFERGQSNAIENTSLGGSSDTVNLSSEVRAKTQPDKALEEPTVTAETQAEPRSLETQGSQAYVSNQVNRNPTTSFLENPEPIESAKSDMNEAQNQFGEETQSANQTQGEDYSGSSVDRFV